MKRMCLATFISMLAGCVNYTGIQSHSAQYSTASLSTHHIYTPTSSKQNIIKDQWWSQFHDANLNQLMQVALADSPTLQIAENRVERAQHVAEEAGASLWPSTNLNTSIRREHFSETGLIPPPFGGTVQNIGAAALNFQYEFDFWGKNRQFIAAQLSQAYATQAELAATQLVVTTAVASTYFQLQSQVAQLKIVEERSQQQAAILKIATTLAHRHIESDIPLSAALANAEAAKANVAIAKQAVLVTGYQLAALLGKNPFTTQVAVSPFQYEKEVLKLPTYLPANLLARRPDIIASRWQVEAAQHQVSSTKAQFFPNINLTALYSYQSINLGSLVRAGNRDMAMGAALNLPIFDAGSLRAKLKTRYAEYDLAVNQYNQAVLTALRQTAAQIVVLRSVQSQLDAHRNLLRANQKNYQLMDLRYQHGVSAYLPTLEAKIRLLNQQQMQLQIETQHILAMVEMIKVLGGDWNGGYKQSRKS